MDIDKIARSAYLMKPEMIEFLLVELLALKLYFHDYGDLEPNEYKVYVQRAKDKFESKTKAHISKWKEENKDFIQEMLNREAAKPEEPS